jgi:hypothetical protein
MYLHIDQATTPSSVSCGQYLYHLFFSVEIWAPTAFKTSNAEEVKGNHVLLLATCSTKVQCHDEAQWAAALPVCPIGQCDVCDVCDDLLVLQL